MASWGLKIMIITVSYPDLRFVHIDKNSLPYELVNGRL